MTRAEGFVLAALLSASCSGSSSTSPSPPGPSTPAVLVGAGDIAECGTRGSQLTSQLLAGIAGTVFTAGDNAYPQGTADNFRDCYQPTWGLHRARTRPSPGNHEYDTPGAAPYFAYFGERAGPPGLGYYRYSLGTWVVLSLNSEVGFEAGSAQLTWLGGELSANPSRCAVAYFHKPRFSSGLHGNHPQVREMWRVLYEHGVDVVISAHDHNYERFAPQNFDGQFDPTRGIRQFVVGTGGAALRPVGALRQNSEVHGSSWGVLVLRLDDGLYRWEFVPAESSGFQDAGTGQCH